MGFQKWAEHVLKWEGGLVNDPDDSGGLTNMGVTWTRFQVQAQSVLGFEPTLETFYNLTHEQAKRFMHEVWRTSKANQMNDPRIAALVAEMSWMSGERIAAGSLQKVLNQRGGKLVEDKVIGPLTLAELHRQNQSSVFRALLAYRENWLKDLAKRRPKDYKFLNGWLNRLRSFSDRFQARSKKRPFGIAILLALFLFK